MSLAEQGQTYCVFFVTHESMGLHLVGWVAGQIENDYETLIYSGLSKPLFGGVPKQNRIFSV